MASQPSGQIKAIIGGNVRAARKRKGLTQTQLSRLVGVESMAVSRWERGTVKPSDANLVALSEALGLDFAAFFELPPEVAA